MNSKGWNGLKTKVFLKAFNFQPTRGVHLRPYSQLAGVVKPEIDSKQAENEESYEMKHLSFYKYTNIEEPFKWKKGLVSLFKQYDVLGRVFVAREGINAQISVKSSKFDTFLESLRLYPNLEDVYFNVEVSNLDPKARTQAFRKLICKVRNNIVADVPFEGTHASLKVKPNSEKVKNVLPDEWDKQLENPASTVIDCRNHYEYEIGRFDKANLLKVNVYRESYAALDEILQDKPKEDPVMIYCTGGIRCVKLGSYLSNQGFSNVQALKGGINRYVSERYQNSENRADVEVDPEMLKEHVYDMPLLDSTKSTFKGRNFVFDDRKSFTVTKDKVGNCSHCKTSTISQLNCKNQKCHLLFLQCEKCNERTHGYCSPDCAKEGSGNMKKDYNPRKRIHEQFHDEGVEKEYYDKDFYYSHKSFYVREKKIKLFDYNDVINQDESDAKQPRSEQKEQSKTEQQNCQDQQQQQQQEQKQEQQTEQQQHQKLRKKNTSQTEEIVEKYCAKYSTKLDNIEILNEMKESPEFSNSIHMLSGEMQGQFLKMLTALSKARTALELGTFTGYASICIAEGLMKGGTLITCDINEKAVNSAKEYINKSTVGKKITCRHIDAEEALADYAKNGVHFDLIFMDSNKGKYLSNYKVIMENKLLSKHGMLVIDNTLFRGLVIGSDDDRHNPETVNASLNESKKERKLNKIADKIHEFNEYVNNDENVEQFILPIRDGLTLIQYKRERTHNPGNMFF